MDTKELARHFGISQDTARRWCAQGKVIGVQKVRGRYEIPEPPLLRYQLKRTKPTTSLDRYYHILRACNRRECATPEDLGCSSQEFTLMINHLVEGGLLLASNEEVVACDTRQYMVTFQGAEYVAKKKTEALALLETFLSLASKFRPFL